MSKVRNLPELLSISDTDLIYAVESAVNPNGGRKASIATLRSAILSAAAVKAAYESNADTNAFTDAEKTKLAGIEAGATADQNAAEVPYDNSVSGLSATQLQAAVDQVNDKAQADFRPSIVSGRILHFTGGTARFDGTFYQLVANDILLNQNITNGEVYVDLDGIVKQTASNIASPPYTIVFARFSTDLNDIISLTDVRVKNAQNIIRGTLSDVRDVRAGAAASEGNSGRVSDAMHKHNILTAAASTQTPDQANAEGTTIELARADHTHNIATAIPSSIGTANAQGSSSAFSRADHIHDHGSQAGGSLHALATNSIAGFMSATDKVTIDRLREIWTLTNEPTGFPNRTDSSISFINGTRTFTIQPTGASFDYWIAGEKFTVNSPQSIQIGTNTGLHFIWFDNNGDIQTSFGPPFPDVFIEPIAFIAVLYWNNTSGELITLGDERHGMTMDNTSHRLVHSAFGAIFNDGLAINSFVIDGDGSLNAQTQFSVGDGSFFDEDLLFSIVNNNPQPLQPAQIPVLYKLGASGDWYKKAANTLPLIYSGTAGYTGANGRIPFNEFDGSNWVLTEADEGNYVWIHVIVANDTTNHVFGVQGIHQYTTVQNARNDLELELVHLGTLAAREQLVIGSILYKTSSTYVNTAKAVTSSVLGQNYVDFRQVLVQVSGASNDHSSLANLQSDSHTQYLNRSGVRPMTGNLDMGGNSITNVNLVDGVDISAHASRHLPNGADPLATASAVGLNANSTNTEGAANTMARSDHTHDLSTGAASTQTPDQANAEGVSTNLARADHVHQFVTAAPATALSPAISNAQGSASSFSRSDHTHSIATALVGDITTIQPNDSASAGIANTYARGDHRHAIASAAPVTNLSPLTANAEGSGSAFSRNDHTHAIATALTADITAIQPDATADAGTANTYARGDHRHAIVADVPVNTGTANSEGNSTSFARANHVHNTVIANSVASATVDDTTASATDVLIVGMTLTPAAGTYLALFSTSAVNSGNGASRMFFSIYSDGVQVAHSEREIGVAGGANSAVNTNAVVTVNGSQAIEARWRAVAGTNTAHERSLTLIRLG